MVTKDLKSSTIGSLFWKLFEQGGAAAITLIVQIVMARILSPDEFGMLAIILVFVNVGNVIVQSGLNTAIIQAPDVTEHDYSTVFWMSLAISLLIYVAIFTAAPTIAEFYSMPGVVWPLRILVLVLVINAYNAIQEAIVARQLEFRKTFRSTIGAGVVSGTCGIASALMGTGIWALVIQQLLYQLCKCIFLAAQIPWKPKLTFEWRRARSLFRFGWKLLVSGLLDQGYQSLSDLIIGRVFTSTELGYVSQGKKYPQALGITLDGAIQPVMLSAVAHVQEEKDQVKRLARRALKTSTFLIVPAMTMFGVVASPLVTLLLGEKWLPCVHFLQMYCFIYALQPLHTTNLQVLNGVGRSDLFLKLEVIKKIIGVSIMCFTAFVLRDIYAIVLGYMLNGVICTFINASPNKNVINYAYHEQVRDICPSFLLSGAAALVAIPFSYLGIPRIALVVVQALVMGAAYLALARLFHVEELTYLTNTIKELMIKRNPRR